MQKKEVIEARKALLKEKGVSVDKKMLENGTDEAFKAALETAEPKGERKPREVKIKHAPGSPHDVMHKFIDSLSATQADYLHRHVIKKALKDEHADGASFEGELFNGVRSKLIA